MSNKTSRKNTVENVHAMRSSPVASASQLLRPLSNPALDKSVINALILMIEQSKLMVGDRLPPEQTLASCLGVGRSTIREALKLGEHSIPIHGNLANAVVAGETSKAVQHMLEISNMVDDEVRKQLNDK